MKEIAGGQIKVLWGEERQELNNIRSLRIEQGKMISDITVKNDIFRRNIGTLQNMRIGLDLIFNYDLHSSYLQEIITKEYCYHEVVIGEIKILEGYFVVENVSFDVDKEALVSMSVDFVLGKEVE